VVYEPLAALDYLNGDADFEPSFGSLCATAKAAGHHQYEGVVTPTINHLFVATF
jgi:hypothetical protein